MPMEPLVLAAKRRTLQGKAVAKLRHEQCIPAVLYGHDVAPVSLAVAQRDFSRVFRQAGESTLLDLRVEDMQPVKVLIHDMQHHPLSGTPLHIDFYQVRMDEKITADIPFRFIGESPAVKELGGVLVKNADHLKISCLPGDLVSELIVDISTLKTFDDAVRIQEVRIPAGLDVLEKGDAVIATVIPPRSEEELKALEEKPEEDIEAVEKVEKKLKEAEEGEETAETGAEGAPSAEKTPENKPGK